MRSQHARTHVIIGAQGAVGRALVQQLVHQTDDSIVGVGRTMDNARGYETFKPIVSDLSADAHPELLELERIDSLSFCHAVALKPMPIAKIQAQELIREWEAYVQWPLNLIQELSARLKESRATIVFVGSEATQTCPVQWGSYVLAKAAQAQLVRQIDSEWGRFGVRTHEVVAGLMQSEMVEALPERLFDMLREKGELDDPMRVAREIAALITGQELRTGPWVTTRDSS